MSRMYDYYINIKFYNQNIKEKDKILLFKTGKFYTILGLDAKKVSSLFNFKLLDFLPKFPKCSFPVNSLEKYRNRLKSMELEVQVIDMGNPIYMYISEVSVSYDIENKLKELVGFDIDNLRVDEIYNYVSDLQELTIKAGVYGSR